LSSNGLWAADRLSLSQAIQTALSQHAAVRAAAERQSGAQGLIRQAHVLPNPVLSLQSENMRAWGTPSFHVGSDTDLFFFGSQTFETGQKRRRRVELAQYDFRIAGLEKELVEWRIRRQVKQSYLKALSAQKQLELLAENARYLEQVVEYHKVRLEQGAIAEADVLRVQLERERVLIAQKASEAEAERERIELLRAMGVTQIQADFQLEDVPALVASQEQDLPALLQRVREENVSLRLAQAVLDRARKRVELEKAQAKPDLEFSLGYKRTAGFNTLIAGVSVPLPLFDRKEGNIIFSEREVKRAESMIEEARAQNAADLNAALAGMRRRREILSSMESGILRQAENSLQISNAAYREGGADLLRLLDAQRVRNEILLLFARTQMEYIMSVADLEDAVGVEDFLFQKEARRVAP